MAGVSIVKIEKNGTKMAIGVLVAKKISRKEMLAHAVAKLWKVPSLKIQALELWTRINEQVFTDYRLPPTRTVSSRLGVKMDPLDDRSQPLSSCWNGYFCPPIDAKNVDNECSMYCATPLSFLQKHSPCGNYGLPPLGQQ
jgi:hypothetical protein